MPFGFRRFSPAPPDTAGRSPINTSPMPFGFRRFSPVDPGGGNHGRLGSVTNAFRLPPLFSLKVESQYKSGKPTSPMPFGFRRFSPWPHWPTVRRQGEGHQCLSASAAFLPGKAHGNSSLLSLSPMPFGFRRFSPGVMRKIQHDVQFVTNAFRLPPLFSQQRHGSTRRSRDFRSPMPFGFRRFSPVVPIPWGHVEKRPSPMPFGFRRFSPG